MDPWTVRKGARAKEKVGVVVVVGVEVGVGVGGMMKVMRVVGGVVQVRVVVG